MAISREQEELYKKTMEEAKRQLESIDSEMEKEIQKARERLAKLQESKKSYQQVYEGAAKLLGISVDPGDEDKDNKESTEPNSQ